VTFKQKVHKRCCDLLNEKISSLRKTLVELEEGSESDNKSSAGDKHETARAMMQIEQEKLGKQLNEILVQLSELEKIDPVVSSAQVAKGGLVTTNNGILFVSVALGKIVVDEKTVMALSPKSPLGVKLMGLKANDSTEINGTNYTVKGLE
jgi:transcription elongation GreA/GreB family factor